MTQVTLYAKPGCCLCEEVRSTLSELGATHAFELTEVDISLDPVLNRQYGWRIPVVAIDGDEAFELQVSRHDLATRLDTVQT